MTIFRPLTRINIDCDPEGDEDSEAELLQGAESGMITGISSPEDWTPNSVVGLGRESRSILITGEFNEELAAAICTQIWSLQQDSDTLPIYVYVNSGGGDVTAFFAIYDTLLASPCPIVTIAMGNCASAGFLILQAGNCRLAYPNTRLFWHEAISMDMTVTPIQAATNYQQYQLIAKRLKKLVIQRSGMSKKKFKKYFENNIDFSMTTTQALKFGLIDEIIEPAAKKNFAKIEDLVIAALQECKPEILQD